ncbi:MAG TPA: hypothetical protein VGB85_23395, partial [Nannocystis sp.]
MIAPLDLWHRISLAGVGPDMEDSFRRKIVLTNQISALAGAAVLVISLVGRIAVAGQTVALVLLAFGVAGYFSIPLLNHARRHELARVVLTLLPPIHTILDT